MKTNKIYKRDADLNLQTRTLALRLEADGQPTTLDAASRSVAVTCATENPVRVMDYETYTPVDEILLMSGCMVPEGRQVPLLDSHARYSTDSVIGSCRGLNISGQELLGRAHFADDPDVDKVFNKLRGGHITDFSIGYTIDEVIRLNAGESTSINGRDYAGPLRLVTSWTVKELSICPIGADPAAKARALGQNLGDKSNPEIPTQPLAGQPAPKNKDDAMDKRLRAFLESRGLPKDATEDQAWEHFRALETAPDTAQLDTALNAAIASERQRVFEIATMGRTFNCETQAASLIAEGASIDSARAKIMEHIATATPAATPGFRVQVGTDERDKFRTAAEDALCLRAGISIAAPAEGAVDLRGYSLRELARHSLQLANQPTGGDIMEMLGRAMTTGDLPNILANVANKSLFTGYDTAGETWAEWCDTGSVNDFKTNTLAMASELSDLDQITEEQPYKYGEMSDAKEQYSIATYGKLFAVNRTAIINDDLGAITTIPMKHGEAAARKVGDIAYAVLTANGTMRDSKALFHTDHGNIGSAAVISETTIAEAIKLMKLQKDLASKRRLNIRAEYYIGPATQEGLAEIFFNSTVFSGSGVGSTRSNPYAGNRFKRVYDARLDDASTTAYYLAGPKGKTVTVFFLGGKQTPYLETRQGWSVDGAEFKVRIDAGAKALDWKALVKNAGG